jgi:hypothetical protein
MTAPTRERRGCTTPDVPITAAAKQTVERDGTTTGDAAVVAGACPICEHTAEFGWNGLNGKAHCCDSPRAGIRGCHATWGGKSRLHTVCCHRTFSGDSAERRFHRDRGGNCRTEAALARAGAVQRDGVWGFPPPGTPWTRGEAPSADDAGETPLLVISAATS